jgi:hypothetical protein
VWIKIPGDFIMKPNHKKVISVFVLFLFTISLFVYSCSNTNRQAHTQELIDLIAEVEELKILVEAKQLEKKQLENQLVLKDKRIKEYFDYKDYVGKRCP